jgi:hypothetical protein
MHFDFFAISIIYFLHYQGGPYMNKKIFNGFEYLKQNYRPSDIQKLLDNSKTKREVYQGLKVSEYFLNKYIKHYNLF